MYKNLKRKSSRIQPYDVTSSASSNRKSNQFVSPVVDKDLSLSAATKDTKLTNTSLDKFSRVSNQENLNKSVDELNKLISDNQSEQIKSNSYQLNSLKEIKSFDTHKDGSVSTINNFKLSDQNKKKDEQQDLISRNQLTNKDNLIKINENASRIDKLANKEFNNQPEASQQSTDYDFDSELDQLFNDSLADKISREYDLVKEELDIQDNKIQDNKISTNNLEDDDELFDSDAIVNENSESEDFNLDEDSNQNYAIDKVNEELANELDNDFYDQVDGVEDDLELDSTLIVRSDDPCQSRFIVVNKPEFDLNAEIGFKTASGAPIKIKMSEEEQRIKARRLGIFIQKT